MHPVLGKLQRELSDGLSGLSAEQTQVRRAAGKWSIQQIVEHLVLTYGSTSRILEGRVAKGTPTLARPTLAQRVMQFTVLTVGYFPTGRHSPETEAPPEVTERKLSAKELNEGLAEVLFPMSAWLNEAERLFGAKTRCLSHGTLGPMSVEQWRRFHFVHGEHHLRQILALRKMAGI
jgi:hypothetical protein